MNTNKLLLVALVIFSCSMIHDVACHGSMVKPYTWFDRRQYIRTKNGRYVFDFYGMKSGRMCHAGSHISKSDICPPADFKDQSCANFRFGTGVSCVWYKNHTFVKKPTLFDPKLRTYLKSPFQAYISHFPWRAPGSAPVDSPCGVAGGNLNGCIGGCQIEAGGFGFGPKAEEFDFKHQIHVTSWRIGSIVEVAWGIVANHGGGYSYRLCKVPPEGVRGITEECFQKTPLQFVGDTQWVQYGEDESTRFGFKATRTSCGTFPEGSQWTKNPIPACNAIAGGFLSASGKCTNGAQFPPPRKDLLGYGTNVYNNVTQFQFSIIDKVLVPPHLECGHYVLSFRWDTEQTPQVWNTCASIYLW